MSGENQLPLFSSLPRPATVLVEAAPGRERADLLNSWCAEATAEGATTFLLDCDFDRHGLWTGLDDFLGRVMEDLETSAPELVEEHSYELAVVFPLLRRRMTIRNESLTDSGPADERTRNFSVDRAFRIVHGLVDLTCEWNQRHGEGPLVIACDAFDRAGALVRRFFQALMRRRGEDLDLVLLITVDPGRAECWPETAQDQAPLRRVKIEGLRVDAEEAVDREAMLAEANALEERVKHGSIELQVYLPRLLHCLQHCDDGPRLVLWQAVAFGVYNHFGFYEDAHRFAGVVRENLDMLEAAESPTFWDMTRWNLVGNLFSCYIGVGEIEQARDIVEQDALVKITSPEDLPRIHWVLSMLYIRYLEERDIEKAEYHLNEGLRIIQEAGDELKSKNRNFLETFLENGLALVRHRQGRFQEAIELCQRGYHRLEENMPSGSHRLHRSVLLYNIAQVYAQIGEPDEAISYYNRAMAMDPNYSEYYNERGNMYFKKGNYAQAIADYRAAISLSSPYHEVWTNLGQVLRKDGQLADAAEAYSRAIDLEPTETLALLGRAGCYEELGRDEEALQDYSSALLLDPEQPMALANRAVLHYCAGRLTDSLADLDAALAFDPENPGVLENRAVALRDSGRFDDAIASLESCRPLLSSAEDVARVDQQLAELRATLVA